MAAAWTNATGPSRRNLRRRPAGPSGNFTLFASPCLPIADGVYVSESCPTARMAFAVNHWSLPWCTYNSGYNCFSDGSCCCGRRIAPSLLVVARAPQPACVHRIVP
jgi:hypothetical protein